MKNITLGAALAVSLISTLAISSPAMAQDGAATEQAGHYEWRNGPWTIGANKVRTPHRVRVWVGPKMDTAVGRPYCKPSSAKQSDHVEWQMSSQQQPGSRAQLLAPVRVEREGC